MQNAGFYCQCHGCSSTNYCLNIFFVYFDCEGPVIACFLTYSNILIEFLSCHRRKFCHIGLTFYSWGETSSEINIAFGWLWSISVWHVHSKHIKSRPTLLFQWQEKLFCFFLHDYTDFSWSRGLDGFFDYFAYSCSYDTKISENVYDIL